LAPRRIAQACAIPFRVDGREIAFCLITSLKKKRWIFPKGIVDAGETAEEAALKEALEEAGLRGRIIGEPLGKYEDSKWGATLDVTVFLMMVECCEDDWPEADWRDRCWVGPAEALRRVVKPEMKLMLNRVMERISPDDTIVAWRH